MNGHLLLIVALVGLLSTVVMDLGGGLGLLLVVVSLSSRASCSTMPSLISVWLSGSWCLNYFKWTNNEKGILLRFDR